MNNDVVLVRIKGLGHVPSFKNKKMLSRGKLITDPNKQKWMAAAIDSLQSQLLSLCPIEDSGTEMAQRLRSWIACSLPANDSCRYLIKCSWKFITVPKGEEGARMSIEEAQTQPHDQTA